MEENTKEKIESVDNKKPNKLLIFILKHKTVLGLLFVILALLVYHMIKINSLENVFIEQTETLKIEHAQQLDSLKIVNLKQTINVFSWAVRSEMSRNNLEQVNQFFLAFVKENDIRMISLINTENAQIILSTDKKNEGQEITDKQVLDVNELKLLEDSETLQVVVPIMGLNKKIGILNVEIVK
ncbi:MAG: hypothetical protein MUO60_03935 [Clostridiaceae bacterium]|nr:hypothetical protein [Clostridiaceae bacterium]